MVAVWFTHGWNKVVQNKIEQNKCLFTSKSVYMRECTFLSYKHENINNKLGYNKNDNNNDNSSNSNNNYYN